MILPKLLSIDTSIFGNLARDYFSDNRKINENAKKTVDYLIEQGLVPFISFHHVQEILQHKDDNVVFQRWSLIKRFPIVAWMRSFEESNTLGSILDIHKLEVQSQFENIEITVEELFHKFRKNLVRYTSGEEFIKLFEPLYCELRELGMIDVQRSKEIESLSHVRDNDIDKIKLSELNKSVLKDQDEVSQYMVEYEKVLAKALGSRGDKKLLKKKLIARKFVEQVEAEGNALYLNLNLSLLEAFVQNAGVRMDQITSATTVGDLGYLGIYNSKINQILESLDIPLERAVELAPEFQTAWVIWEFIDRVMRSEKRAQGSNMVDKHMSIFALYVDVFTVDKRIKEYFRQMARKIPILHNNFRNIVKLSHFSDLRNIT